MVNGMVPTTISVDKAGRLVLPKAVRDGFRLRAGSKLELEVCGDHLRLRPVDAEPALVQVDGWWVHQGRAASDDLLVDALQLHRDNRLSDVSK